MTAQYHSILLLSGDRGVGKSTALARWLKEFEDENSGIFLIHHFIGALPGDNDISVFMSQCVRRLRRHFLLTGSLEGVSLFPYLAMMMFL